jgi:anti-anti-sigma factor
LEIIMVCPALEMQAGAVGLYETRIVSGRCDVVLSGEVDLCSADDVLALALTKLVESDVQTLVLDLAAVTFLDASALAAFIRIQAAAHNADKDLRLRNPSARSQRVLRLAGLDTTFPIDSAGSVPSADRAGRTA